MKATHYQRLVGLRLANDERGQEMNNLRARFDSLAGRHENGTAPVAVSSFNLFQTPEPIAARMAQMVADHVGNAARILEPSAGLGRIYKALKGELQSSRVVMVESSADCCGALYRCTGEREGDRIFQRDFLECSPDDIGGGFDAVCMNPPFKQGADIKHIVHALRFLAPGGLLVSLCYDGARQNAWLKPRCASWEVLPPQSFKAEGTGASVALVTMNVGAS